MIRLTAWQRCTLVELAEKGRLRIEERGCSGNMLGNASTLRALAEVGFAEIRQGWAFPTAEGQRQAASLRQEVGA